jgi:glycosyltransferase involved in cell wall biosynthesis
VSLRILQVCGTGEGGRWFLDQVVELVARGHDVEAVVPAAGTLERTLKGHGVRVHVIPFRGYRPQAWARLMRAQRDLDRLIHRGGFDIVHAHLLKAVVSARLSCVLRPHPPLVSQVTGLVHLESAPLNLIDRLTSPCDDALVASCTNFADVYRHRGAKNVFVSHYGCHVEEFSPSDGDRQGTRRALALAPDEVAVGMVAHMYPSRFKSFRDVGVKGHETFIDAAARVVQRSPQTRFFIVGDEFVGDGSYRRALEERAASLGLAGRLEFLGHRSDIQDVVSAMDILANPSLSESASYTVIEASLMEKPVVASRVGGLTDTVLDGVTGTLVPPADASSLASAIVRYAQDPELRDAHGREGRRRVAAMFDIRTTVSSVEAIYLKVISARV